MYKRLELAMATLGEVNGSRLAASLMAESGQLVETPVAGIVFVYVREVGN